jgi:hypothetical protein
VYLIIPVPAIGYLAAALIAGLIHDRDRLPGLLRLES